MRSMHTRGEAQPPAGVATREPRGNTGEVGEGEGDTGANSGSPRIGRSEGVRTRLTRPTTSWCMLQAISPCFPTGGSEAEQAGKKTPHKRHAHFVEKLMGVDTAAADCDGDDADEEKGATRKRGARPRRRLAVCTAAAASRGRSGRICKQLPQSPQSKKWVVGRPCSLSRRPSRQVRFLPPAVSPDAHMRG